MTISRIEILRMVGIRAVFALHLPQAVMKVTSAAHFSNSLIHRFTLGTNMKAPEIKKLLSSIHSFQSWPKVLSNYAAKLEREGRQLLAEGEDANEVAKKLVQASLFYHYAQIVGCDNLSSRLSFQKKTQELYKLAAPNFFNPATRVEIPFGPVTLPGYLRLPQQQARALIIFVNGANTVKEEFHRLSSLFVHKGYATLIFDDPGSGEAWGRIKGTTKQGAVAKAILDHLHGTFPLLPEKTVLFGISMGGMKAMHMAAEEPRISGVVSISGPFDAGRYFKYLNPLIHKEIDLYFGYPGEDRLQEIVERSSLNGVAERIKKPVFVAGGKSDTIVPYRDAERAYAALPDNPLNQLNVYDSGHICLSRFSELITDVLNWLPKV